MNLSDLRAFLGERAVKPAGVAGGPQFMALGPFGFERLCPLHPDCVAAFIAETKTSGTVLSAGVMPTNGLSRSSSEPEKT